MVEHPKVHCLTNPVSMQGVANLLLAAGGSAIMAQDVQEAAEITAICDATLLNTGVPDEAKFEACILAGREANRLGHPVVLDPVGAGASLFRKKGIDRLLKEVNVSAIRCNQEEACTLLHIEQGLSGGVESAVSLNRQNQREAAEKLAKTFSCAVLVSGRTDVVSDGITTRVIEGGDERISRITGSGCMLSALCAFFCGMGMGAFQAVEKAARIWKECSENAGKKTDENGGGIGAFPMYLFDCVSNQKFSEKKA